MFDTHLITHNDFHKGGLAAEGGEPIFVERPKAAFIMLAADWRLKNRYFFKGAIPDGTLSSRRVVPHPSSPWADFPKCHDSGRESTI